MATGKLHEEMSTSHEYNGISSDAVDRQPPLTVMLHRHIVVGKQFDYDRLQQRSTHQRLPSLRSILAFVSSNLVCFGMLADECTQQYDATIIEKKRTTEDGSTIIESPALP